MSDVQQRFPARESIARIEEQRVHKSQHRWAGLKEDAEQVGDEHEASGSPQRPHGVPGIGPSHTDPDHEWRHDGGNPRRPLCGYTLDVASMEQHERRVRPRQELATGRRSFRDDPRHDDEQQQRREARDGYPWRRCRDVCFEHVILQGVEQHERRQMQCRDVRIHWRFVANRERHGRDAKNDELDGLE